MKRATADYARLRLIGRAMAGAKRTLRSAGTRTSTHSPTVRAFVRDASTAFGGSKRAADDLVQAVDEATCNVILHGYTASPASIEIEAAVRDGRSRSGSSIGAPAFDPTGRPDPRQGRAAGPDPPGGMGVGIELLRTMTDEVHHSARPDGGNELTLVRSIDSRQAQED